MATKKQKTPARGLSATDKRDGVEFTLALYDSHNPPACQTELTPERRLRFARLAQDLGLFAYEQVIARLDEPDEVFNPHLKMLARCVSVVEAHLEQVAL